MKKPEPPLVKAVRDRAKHLKLVEQWKDRIWRAETLLPIETDPREISVLKKELRDAKYGLRRLQ